MDSFTKLPMSQHGREKAEMFPASMNATEAEKRAHMAKEVCLGC